MNPNVIKLFNNIHTFNKINYLIIMNDLKLCDFIPKKEKPKLNFPIRSTTANANKIQSNKYPTVVRIRNNSSSYNQVNRNINYSKIVTKNYNLENSSPK